MSALPSLTTRIVQVSCAIAWCLVAAGPVFGYAALKPILIAEGIYENKCDLHSTDSITKCIDQDLSLNFLFTLACMVTNISALPVGSILDTYGPKVTGIIGSIVIAMGSLGLKYGDGLFFDGYLAGYSLLALGGPFVFISCFQLANSFPKNSGLILALLTGAFDSSSALFLVYRVIYFKVEPIPLSIFFNWYLIIPSFILLCQIFIMPSTSYKTVATLAKIAETAIDETGRPLDDDLLLPADRDAPVAPHTGHPQPTITETTALLLSRDNRRASLVSTRSSTKSIYEQQADDELVHKSGGVYGILHGYNAIDQLKSTWFVLLTLFITIQMLRINYFVATIKTQERYLYNDEDVATVINHVFDIALPLGGLVAIPFIGLVLDNLTTLVVLLILTIISVFVGVMGLFSYLPATYAGIFVLVVYRPFYYTAISHIFSIVFGFDNFGVLYGSAIAISGAFNILQQLLDHLTKSYYQGNPTPINAMLTLATAILGSILILFVQSQEAQIKRKNLEFEAEGAFSTNIPN